MSALQREQIVDNYVSALTADISSAVTTIPVSSIDGLPTSEDFRIIIEDEIMLVTAVSAGQLTVTRAVEGTTPTAHVLGTTVYSCFTAGGVEQYVHDRVPLHRDPVGVGHMSNSAGASLTLDDWTWFNRISTEGTATATEMSNGDIRLTNPTHSRSGPNIQGFVLTAPATPYIVTARFCFSAWGNRVTATQLPETMMLFRESATSKIIALYYRNDLGIAIGEYTDEQNFSSFDYTLVRWVSSPTRFWFQIEDDGTSLYFRFSNTGMAWSTLSSQLRGNFFTVGPNQVGWGMNARFQTPPSNTTYSTRLQHWSFA